LIRLVIFFVFVFRLIAPLQVVNLLVAFWSNKWKRCIIDTYVVLWFFLEIGLLFILYSCQPSNCWLLFIVFLACWRWSDIFHSSFRLSFIRQSSLAYLGEPKPIPLRSLALLGLNYLEMIMIYAVIYFIWQSSSPPSVSNSLEYGFSVFVPFVGINDSFFPGSLVGKVLFSIEILFSILFHLFILQQVASLFRNGKY